MEKNRKLLIASVLMISAIALPVIYKVYCDVIAWQAVTTHGRLHFQPTASISVSPATIEWGSMDLDLGDPVTAGTITITNDGDVPYRIVIYIPSISISPTWLKPTAADPNPLQLSWDYSPNNLDLYPGDSQSVVLTLTFNTAYIREYMVENHIDTFDFTFNAQVSGSDYMP